MEIIEILDEDLKKELNKVSEEMKSIIQLIVDLGGIKKQNSLLLWKMINEAYPETVGKQMSYDNKNGKVIIRTDEDMEF